MGFGMLSTRRCVVWRIKMDHILEVKHLKIAFRTTAGTLKAVRDISFDLEKGKTLAIVGESGSGKSVTSRAIMGILAGNAIVEGGEIFYDGKDLMHISEEEMQKIRGDKISMIFQDPLSSLNPIVQIGPQITEAMLLKNRTSRREAKRDFSTLLGDLKTSMKAVAPTGGQAEVDRVTEEFNRLVRQSTKLESGYNASMEKLQAAAVMIDDIIYKTGKAPLDLKPALRKVADTLKKAADPFALGSQGPRLLQCRQAIEKAAQNGRKLEAGKDVTLPEEAQDALDSASVLLRGMLGRQRPDFLAVGYYQSQHPHEEIASLAPEVLNAQTQKALDEGFMNGFRDQVEKAAVYSARQSVENKKKLLPELQTARAFYAGDFSRGDGVRRCKALAKQVSACIDRLDVVKDSASYAFGSSLCGAIDRYFQVKAANPKEERRFARQSARRERLIARGKKVTWKVVPKNVYDLEDLHGNITGIFTRLENRCAEDIAAEGALDARKRCDDIVETLKKKASQMVAHVSKSMARERALQLMEEVGINNPRERFNQYPFEFSGGMRQRIVIAIALAADPDILICDEPTTALDVTIQAQILELINKLKKERNLSIIFITHDLGVVANMADNIAVMYAGKIVEYGTVEEVFYAPAHPYTWALLASMPDLETKEKLEAIPGTPPNMIYPPKGDAFADRNRYAMEIDFEQQPPEFRVSDTHWAATWLLHPYAPKTEPPKTVTERIAKMKARLEEQAHA